MTGIGEKVAWVMRQGQTRNHLCHWPGCRKQVPPARWGCLEHWRRLPASLRRELWQAYQPGQEVKGTPSAAYVAVARRVQDWIAGEAPQRSPALRCPACGEDVHVLIAFDDREGCAACWLAGRASSAAADDAAAAPDAGTSSSTPGDDDNRTLSRRVWNKGSARTAGPAKASRTVLEERGRLVRCPKCRGLRYEGTGPHAPHANGRGELVDCVGDLLAPALAAVDHQVPGAA